MTQSDQPIAETKLGKLKGFVKDDIQTFLGVQYGKSTAGKRRFMPPESPDPYVQEHKDLVNHIRSGEHINETETVTKSTATAILGRMSAYTGNMLSWGWMMNASKLDLSPKAYTFGPNVVDPVARPGVTELV